MDKRFVLLRYIVKKKEAKLLSVCVFVYLETITSIYLSIYLSVCMCVNAHCSTCIYYVCLINHLQSINPPSHSATLFRHTLTQRLFVGSSLKTFKPPEGGSSTPFHSLVDTIQCRFSKKADLNFLLSSSPHHWQPR